MIKVRVLNVWVLISLNNSLQPLFSYLIHTGIKTLLLDMYLPCDAMEQWDQLKRSYLKNGQSKSHWSMENCILCLEPQRLYDNIYVQCRQFIGLM